VTTDPSWLTPEVCRQHGDGRCEVCDEFDDSLWIPAEETQP
jgi:hypothetical protein